MKVFVCIKQVPDTTNVRINPETNTLVREGVQSIINPFRRLRPGGRRPPEGKAWRNRHRHHHGAAAGGERSSRRNSPGR